jgi:hypothetical protein
VQSEVATAVLRDNIVDMAREAARVESIQRKLDKPYLLLRRKLQAKDLG